MTVIVFCVKHTPLSEVQIGIRDDEGRWEAILYCTLSTCTAITFYC